ncbi:MAG: DUF5916 domain-containing protein [Gemmatimonadota bacterium]
MPRFWLPLLIVAAVCAPETILAQNTSASVHPTAAPSASASPRNGAILIDGKLDDAGWQGAKLITQFTQTQPNEAAPATQRTEVRVLYDNDAIYIGARMFDSLGRTGVRAPLARRDQLLNGDQLTTDKIAIVLDPYHNHLDRVWFEVNPAGVKGEHFNNDNSFDPIWEASAQIDSLGWTAEMRIPLSQLRFSRDSIQTWGMQLWRYVDRLNEQDMWSFWKRNEAGGPPYFGHLEGLQFAGRTRQIELLPYAIFRQQYKYADPFDPFHKSANGIVRWGGDAKVLLTSNLTLDATVNPDFGQVEVDPATVNLSAFETFFSEKRPFFVAGRQAFSFGNFNCFFCDNVSSLDLFYTRRIGRAPQLNGLVDSRASFADLPENTQILGAGKVTGRANGFTVGILDAVTNREAARYRTGATATSPTLTQEVEPLSNYFVGRVRRDFRDGATTFGAILTSTTRKLEDSLLVNRLRSHANVIGFDMEHAWSKRDYSVLASVALSDVGGSDSAMAATQQSSARYFQRIDRHQTSDGLFDTRYDQTRNSLRGYGLYARLGKDNGDWLWETAQNWRSPGFEVNDIAFLNRADYKWMLANVVRQWTTPMGPFRYLNITAGAQRQYNYDGDVNDEEEHYGIFSNLKNYWGVNTFYIHHPSSLDETITRGGPVVMRTGYDYYSSNVSTDNRKTTVLSMRLDYGHGINSLTNTWRINPSIAIKPATNVFVSIAPSYNDDDDAAQYVRSVADATVPAFGGTRYVFAYLKQKTVSIDTRVNWTFTPDLTLELFAQPFVASGAYSQFRQFARPRSVDKQIYGLDVGSIAYASATRRYTVDPDGSGPAASFSIDDPDFTVRSLRGNAVLRWQYRPGSTVFFVWTQERNGFDAVGQFDLRNQSSEIFRDRPVNIFLVKVNYWLGR